MDESEARNASHVLAVKGGAQLAEKIAGMVAEGIEVFAYSGHAERFARAFEEKCDEHFGVDGAAMIARAREADAATDETDHGLARTRYPDCPACRLGLAAPGPPYPEHVPGCPERVAGS